MTKPEHIEKASPFRLKNFDDLFGEQMWQLIHAGISADAEVGLDIVLRGLPGVDVKYNYLAPLPDARNNPSFCSHIRKYRSAEALCRQSESEALDEFLRRDEECGGALDYFECACHMGLYRVIFPLRIHKQVVGFLLVGGLRLAGNEGIALLRHEVLGQRTEWERRRSIMPLPPDSVSQDEIKAVGRPPFVRSRPGYQVFPASYSLMQQLTHIRAIHHGEKRQILAELKGVAAVVEERLEEAYQDAATAKQEEFLREIAVRLPKTHELSAEVLKARMNEIAQRICEFCNIRGFVYMRRPRPGKPLEALVRNGDFPDEEELKRICQLPDLPIDPRHWTRLLRLLPKEGDRPEERDRKPMEEMETFGDFLALWREACRAYIHTRPVGDGSCGRVDDLFLFGRVRDPAASLVETEHTRWDFHRIAEHLPPRLDSILRILWQQEFIAEMAHESVAPFQGLENELGMIFDVILPKRSGGLSLEEEEYRDYSEYHMDQFRQKQLNWLYAVGGEGKKRINKRRCTPAAALSRALEVYRPEAKRRGIEFAEGYSLADLPEVDIDDNLIEQVFNNILSNAMKYTQRRRQSGETPRIELAREDKPGELLLSFSNFGRGIRPEWIEAGMDSLIFERGWRCPRDEDPDNYVPGTGIGCTIIKEIMVLHGGEVLVESHKGGKAWPRQPVDERYLSGCKTTFTLVFPLP